jgi:hypothetical protein
MEKLIVYPANEGQAKALKVIFKGMRIEYGQVGEEGVEEVEDAELLAAMKEVESEAPMTDKEQAEFLSWIKGQV